MLESGESMTAASTWVDKVRGRTRETASWHYADVPLDEPKCDRRYSGDHRAARADRWAGGRDHKHHPLELDGLVDRVVHLTWTHEIPQPIAARAFILKRGIVA